MKRILLCLFYLLLAIELFACSCLPPPPFLEYVASEEFADRGGVVWDGEYIQDMPIPGTALHATQYLIRNIWCGSFVDEVEYVNDTPGDPPFVPSTDWIDDFQISEDKVWVIGGDGATCLETHGNNDMIFATTYDHTWGPAFGYSTNLCVIDFFPISSTNVVTGFINSNETSTAMTVDELLAAVNDAFDASESECEVANGIENSAFEMLRVFPNPVIETLNFAFDEPIKANAEVMVYSISGALVGQYELEAGETNCDVKKLSSGKYFFTLNDQSGRKLSGQFIK